MDKSILYKEEKDKLSDNIVISTTMNQSINNFLVIQTFIASICFYLSKYYLNYTNFSNWFFPIILIAWAISCILNLIILSFLIWQLFSIIYAFPIFKESYANKLISFVNKGKNTEALYEDWFKTYRKVNHIINFHRQEKIKLFKKLKIVSIASIILLSLSSVGLGYYIHDNNHKPKKEVNMCNEKDNEQQVNENENTQNEKQDDSVLSAENQSTESQSKQHLDSQENPPSSLDQIEIITASEQPDATKVQEEKNDDSIDLKE
ncbi:MAG: hypothetical protein KAK00_09230 [Nanoarchaeota archaeon]|nr:hypothetical protein [Nanoarchaeota archaeon]MCK5491529.1 hypothetical protein [Candidatus Omnitrophota bacterium]